MTANPPIQMKTIGDVMIPIDRYPMVQDGCTLRDAIHEIERGVIEHDGRRSLPRVILVVDEDGELAGTVRRRDLMRGLVPPFLRSVSMPHDQMLVEVGADPNLSLLSIERLIPSIRAQADRPIRDVMQPPIKPVDAEEPVFRAAYEMVNANLALLPVSRQGRLAGVVRSVEVFRELSRLVLTE